MYTGWIPPFDAKPRLLAEQERDEPLLRDGYPNVEPDERSALIRLNSTYIDWIDRRFFMRGMMNLAIVFLGVATAIVASIWFAFLGVLEGDKNIFGENYFLSLGLLVLFVIPIYFLMLKYEFFTYTHYPIRFNRKTRKIHVFRHNGPGGVLTVPWDEAYFHIGRSKQMALLRDIRCQVMDGDTVTDTFVLGHFFERTQPVLEMWEFIRRYMEEGPEAVGPDPLDRYVSLSVSTSWKNCMLWASTYCNANTPAKRFWRSPLIGWFLVTRWVIFKTCKAPAFSAEIEAQCVVEANDPNVWPIPASTGEFVLEHPDIMERAIERAKRSYQAELDANDMNNPRNRPPIPLTPEETERRRQRMLAQTRKKQKMRRP